MASLSCIVEKTKRKELTFRKLIWVARQFARSMHKSLQVTPWKPHAVFIPFPSFWLENWDLRKGNDLAQGLTLTWGLLFHILYIPRKPLYIGIKRIHMWQFIYVQWFFFFNFTLCPETKRFLFGTVTSGKIIPYHKTDSLNGHNSKYLPAVDRIKI